MGAKKKKSKSKGGVLSKAKTAYTKYLGSSKGTKGGRRKKSALWYAKEIQRIRLKRKYEKIKFRV